MRTATLDDYKHRILRVMVHVQNHLEDPLDLDRLAGVAAFSPYHFHRVWKGMVGEPLDAYVRRLRLERAATRLKTTDRPIVDLALEALSSTIESVVPGQTELLIASRLEAALRVWGMNTDAEV